MVYGKGQLVAFAVGGGGAIVAAAVVIGYLIGKLRDSKPVDADVVVLDAGELVRPLDNRERDNDIVSASDAAEGEKAFDTIEKSDRAGSIPAIGEDSSISASSSLELDRTLEDLVRLSASSGISEEESPSFDDILAIENEEGDVEMAAKVDLRAEVVPPTLRDSVDDARIPTGQRGELDKKDDNESREDRMPVVGRDVVRGVPDVVDSIFQVDADFENVFVSDLNIVARSNGDNSALGSQRQPLTSSPLPMVVDCDIPPSSNLAAASPSSSPSLRKSASASSNGPSTSSRRDPTDTTLDDLAEQTTVLSPSESRSLVAFLASPPNASTLRRTLFITANAASFPANQYFLRRAGCIPILNRLLESTDEDVVHLCEKALSNLAVNEENLEYMKDSILPLVANANRKNCAQIRLEALVCLTNLTTFSLYHEKFIPSINNLIANIDDDLIEFDVRLQSLKLLINLSVNAVMTPYIWASKCFCGLTKWLALTPTGKPHQDALELNFALRICHLLSNLLEVFGGEPLKEICLPVDVTGIEWEETLLNSLASEVQAVTIRRLLFDLNRHPETEIRYQGKRLYALLAPLWRKFKAETKTNIIHEEDN